MAELLHRLNVPFNELETRPFGFFTPQVGALHRDLVGRVIKGQHPRELGADLLENL